MFVRCKGWPAPHVPPIILRDGDGLPSDGMCPSCDAVLRLLDASRSLRLQRFIDRIEFDRDRAYLSGSVWSDRDRALAMERLR